MLGKGVRGGGRLVEDGLRPHLFSVSCSPCFDSWLPMETPGVCMGRLEKVVNMAYLI